MGDGARYEWDRRREQYDEWELDDGDEEEGDVRADVER